MTPPPSRRLATGDQAPRHRFHSINAAGATHVRLSYNLPYGFKCPRRRGLAPGLRPLCAFGAGAKPWGRSKLRPRVETWTRSSHGQNMPPAGDQPAPGWRGRRTRLRARRGVRGVLPSRPPSTQAEPSRRGPGRQGRSYSGALHLDALNHARSTVCGSTADGMEAGEGCWLRKWAAKACRCPLDYHPRAEPPSLR